MVASKCSGRRLGGIRATGFQNGEGVQVRLKFPAGERVEPKRV